MTLSSHEHAAAGVAPRAPDVSILIPVYNEESLLRSAIVDLIDRLDTSHTYEIVLAENGSTDGTLDIAAELEERFDLVRHEHTDEPNYGKALRRAILGARGRWVVCDEIDLCDVDFHRQALALLEAGEADLVIGSKTMDGASDERPVLRRAGTVVINGMLRAALGFRGTDTHGLKAFRADALRDVARACLVDRDLFASELVIRAELRDG